MYALILRNADRTRRFTIRTATASGWEVRVEEDSRIVRSHRYDDWHRVERAKLAFSVEAAGLRADGWIESN